MPLAIPEGCPLVTREQRLATTFVELADSLVEDFDVVDLMVLLTERCVELLDAAAAGLLLADVRGNLHLMAATNDALEMVEIFQVQSDEGPCRDCFHSGAMVSTSDLAEDGDRWPRFAPVAAAAGFRAAHALPLRLRGQVLGALNLFRTEPVALTREDIATAQALADVATIALLQNRQAHDSQMVTDQLQEALNSRIAIEQAKGIIAERLGLSVNEAFTRLRRYARHSGRRLGEVAQEVIDGTLHFEEILTTPSQ
jgi:transcriptional regulator with GAF, ATPase, and Fis domain